MKHINLLICLFVFVFISWIHGGIYPGGNSKCNHKIRIRRSWNTLNEKDKQLFRSAISLSMKNGLFMEFVKLHMEKRGNLQSHYTSAFAYWHRSLTLGFENMLRSLGPLYKCLTIPYWPIFDEYVDQISGLCKGNLTYCSPVTTELCGKKGKMFEEYEYKTLVINNRNARGACYNGYPCDAAFQGCALRGNMDTRPIPPLVGYGSLLGLFAKNGFGNFTQSLLGGAHGAVHTSIKGYMNIFASPADPIFYLWHTSVDMIIASFHDCKVGKDQMKKNSIKQNSGYTYEKFQTKLDVPAPPSIYDSLLMYNDNNDTLMLHDRMNKQSRLSPFFIPLENKVWKLVDTRTMHDYSYEYEYLPMWKQGILQTPLCPAFNKHLANKRNLRMEDDSTDSMEENQNSSQISSGSQDNSSDININQFQEKEDNSTGSDVVSQDEKNKTYQELTEMNESNSKEVSEGSNSSDNFYQVNQTDQSNLDGVDDQNNGSSGLDLTEKSNQSSLDALDISSNERNESNEINSAEESLGSDEMSQSDGSDSSYASAIKTLYNGTVEMNESNSNDGNNGTMNQINSAIVSETNSTNYSKWLDKMKKTLEKLYPNDYVKQYEKLSLLECVGFTQTYGSINYNVPFLDGMVTDAVNCREYGDNVVKGLIKTDVLMNGFNPNAIKIAPGVKPAKPAAPISFPPLIKQKTTKNLRHVSC